MKSKSKAILPGLWHRFEERRYSIPDEWGDHAYTRTEIEHIKLFVVKVTKKGVWLSRWAFTEPRFVLFSSTKRFACQTIEEAKESFRRRKLKQASIYENRALIARRLIAMIDRNSPSCLP